MLTSRRCFFVLAAALTVLEAGCKSGPAADPVAMRARAVAAADVRLRGAWVLQSFVPETPLEPMLAGMLAFQFGQLIIKLDGQNAVADSPGLHVQRTYRITDVQGDQFQLVTVDDQGVAYEAAALFIGDNDIRFHSTTMPWKGVGTLRRNGGAAAVSGPAPR
jgi:hypothetical protein